MEQTISAVQARQQLGRMLEEVFYRHSNIVIERAGRPMAVLVSIDRYHQWLAERAALFAQVDEARERTADVPPEELETEIVAAVAAAKQRKPGSTTR